ncbi:MAG: hypothetical protein LBL35_05905 [Clostridiales bacterium]|nr:hypothetical protein [Clostridiales bacterium]
MNKAEKYGVAAGAKEAHEPQKPAEPTAEDTQLEEDPVKVVESIEFDYIVNKAEKHGVAAGAEEAQESEKPAEDAQPEEESVKLFEPVDFPIFSQRGILDVENNLKDSVDNFIINETVIDKDDSSKLASPYPDENNEKKIVEFTERQREDADNKDEGAGYREALQTIKEEIFNVHKNIAADDITCELPKWSLFPPSFSA